MARKLLSRMGSGVGWRGAAASLMLGAALCTAGSAAAQEKTFYLDRAQISGAPQDGFTVWRPYQASESIIYWNLALGFTLNPLHDYSVVEDTGVLEDIDHLVQTQTIAYLSAGTEIASRVGLNVSLPIAVFQTGASEDGPSAPSRNGVGNGLALDAVALHDVRFDLRVRAWESLGKKLRLGGALAAWAPTGNASSYGSDDGASFAIFANMDVEADKFLFAGHVGPHFKPYTSITGTESMLTISDELRVAMGGYYLLNEGRIRVGLELWGSAGLTDDDAGESTLFRHQNSDFEWLAQGRFALDQKQRWFANAGVGTRMASGYGAPDLRVLASIGWFTPLADVDPQGVHQRVNLDTSDWENQDVDTDKDGFPDSIDECKEVPEDGAEPEPGDGCPAPSDKDKDGLLDEEDKCPDEAEDMDNLLDSDGCPETDADNDRIEDTVDKCPNEPGPKNKKPEKHGCPTLTRVSDTGEVQLLENIQFDTARATIRPVSFPILDEVVSLMEARPTIRIGVYGHTDNKGKPEANLKLSRDRAAAVVDYLVSKGIERSRLESEGYGQEKPIDTNDNEAGRSKNRRVEFKVIGTTAE